jgi:hypothetical protein
MSLLKIKEYPGLKRDRHSNGVVNTNKREYEEYKIISARIKAREKDGDEIRNAVKEINNLKAELREIKDLIKGVVNK